MQRWMIWKSPYILQCHQFSFSEKLKINVRTSPSGIAYTLTEEITKRLNAADPTIVDAPNSPGSYPRVNTVSIIERKISGALKFNFYDYLEPSARSVRLAMVGFHTATEISCRSPFSSVTFTGFC